VMMLVAETRTMALKDLSIVINALVRLDPGIKTDQLLSSPVCLGALREPHCNECASIQSGVVPDIGEQGTCCASVTQCYRR
jgi:hypothetical protein